MPIRSFVLKLIMGLQRIVADEMLDLEVQKYDQHGCSRVRHALLPPINSPPLL